MNYLKFQSYKIRRLKPLYLKNNDETTASEDFLLQRQDPLANPQKSFVVHASFFHLALLAENQKVAFFLLNHKYPISKENKNYLQSIESSSKINATAVLEKIETIQYKQSFKSDNIIAVAIKNYTLSQNNNIVAFNSDKTNDLRSEYFFKLGLNKHSYLATFDEIARLISQGITVKPLIISLLHAVKHNELEILKFLVEGKYFELSKREKINLMEIAIKNSCDDIVSYFLQSDELMLNETFKIGCANAKTDPEANEMLLLSSQGYLKVAK